MFSSFERRISQSLGILLVVAAALKLGGLLIDPSADLLSRIPVWLIVVAAELEIVVGLLLIFRPKSSRILVLAAGLFAVLFIFAMRSVISGAKDCGCLGNISVHPAVFAWIDLLALLALSFLALKYNKATRSQMAELNEPIESTPSPINNAFAKGMLIGLFSM